MGSMWIMHTFRYYYEPCYIASSTGRSFWALRSGGCHGQVKGKETGAFMPQVRRTWRIRESSAAATSSLRRV